jgi:hypothetical protein
MTSEVPAEILPSRKFHRVLVMALATVTALAAFTAYLGVDPSTFGADWQSILQLATDMFPPNVPLLW